MSEPYPNTDAKLAISAQIADLFDASEFTDFAILSGPRKWRVHKLIVSAHSDVLKKACLGFKEAQDGQIDLSEDEPEQVEALVEYLYRFDYEKPEGAAHSFHVQMVVLGDKYHVKNLYRLASDKFATCVKNDLTPESAAAAATIAYGAPHATGWIKKVLVMHVFEQNWMTYGSKNPSLVAAMTEHPNFAIDLAQLVTFRYRHRITGRTPSKARGP